MFRLFLFLSLSVLPVFACATPIEIKQVDNDCMRIDIRRLGEYDSSVVHIELTDVQTGKVLWEVDPISGKPAALIAAWDFCVGKNKRIPTTFWGDKEYLQFSITDGGESFVLVRGKKYRVKVEGYAHNMLGVATFSLPKSTTP